MGPVFDILRHHDTRTPLSVGIYGDWGSGKTTAMHWLKHHLDQWNAEGEAENKVIVHSTTSSR